MPNELIRISMLADQTWLSRIDEWRKQQEGPVLTRSEAIRRLVDEAIVRHDKQRAD